MKLYLLLFLQSIALLTFGQKFYIQEDFNNSTLPTDWTTNAVTGSVAWSFGIDGVNPNYSYGAGNQNLDGTPMAFFDDDVLGEYSTNNTAELLSPIFNNAIDSLTYLSFDYNFRGFYLINDSFYVDVFDGSNWKRIFSLGKDDCGDYTSKNCKNNYPNALIDISAYANDSCQIRFTYHDGNDWGFYVGLDNVEVWSALPNDLSVTEVLRPTSNCGLKGNDTIAVKIKNLGHETQKNFTISFELDGKTAVTETVSDSIAYQDFLIYTFTNTGDFSAVGAHQLKVYTSLPKDTNLVNDTISTQNINTYTAFTLPYFTDFEQADSSWNTSGTNSSWEWGVPNGNKIDTAYSGTKAWVTNLNGNYNPLENSYLNFPCFDFSNEIEDPIISFSLYYQTEIHYDYAWLESSVDNGETWQRIETSLFSQYWYNGYQYYTGSEWWDGFSSSWIKATNILKSLAGEPSVKLRFVFKSDGGTHYEGIAIDDVAIFKKQEVDLAIGEINYPYNNSNTSLCGFGNNEQAVFNLLNYGVTSIDSFQVFYQVD